MSEALRERILSVVREAQEAMAEAEKKVAEMEKAEKKE